MKLKITDARAEELEALAGHAPEVLATGLRDALSDRRTLLDALRRGVDLASLVASRHEHTARNVNAVADLRALLASAEGGDDGE